MYERASILLKVANLTDANKTVIIQGLDDTTVMPSQAPLLSDALKAAKKNVDMVLLPAENHVFVKPNSLELVCSKLFELTGVDATGQCVYK